MMHVSFPKRKCIFQQPVRFLGAAVLALGFALAGGGAHASRPLPVQQIYEAKELVCDFYRPDSMAETMSLLGVPQRAHLFMVLREIERAGGGANTASSAKVSIGRRGSSSPLRVYEGEEGLHFVEDRAASVVVTTLTACSLWLRKGGRDHCTRYDAINAWHFDLSVHRDADGAFRRLAASSYRGTCEPWKMP